MLPRWTVELPEGSMLPRFYGVAYYDYRRGMVVCYPVPLNIIVSLLRVFYHWFNYQFRFKFYESRVDKAVRKTLGEGANE